MVYRTTNRHTHTHTHQHTSTGKVNKKPIKQEIGTSYLRFHRAKQPPEVMVLKTAGCEGDH